MEISSAVDFLRMTRGALAGAGFVRQESEGTVWWVSGPSLDAHRESAPHPNPHPLPQAMKLPRGEGTREDEGSRRPDEGSPFWQNEMPTLVMLHGANDHAGTWFTVAPELAKRYRVILPDLAGHGESEPRSGPIPLSQMIARLETAIGGEREVTLLGNSMGGWIAILYTLRHPERVKHLVLEASGGLNRPLAVPLVANTREEAAIILRAVHGPAFVAPEWVAEALLQRASDSPMLRLTEMLEHDVEPRLHEIRTPVTLIWGEHDGVLPLSYARALHEAIAGSNLQVIEDAAHIPHMQQPRRFLECLTAIC